MSTPTPSTTITWAGVGPSTHGGGGNGPIVKARALPAFNLVIEFFEELHTNYQGVKHYIIFNINPMKVCERHTQGCKN
jgi:hypothetical protein